MLKLSRLIFLCLLSLSFYLQAYDASPKCYRDLELNFFQPALVSQALSLHRVDQSTWTPILRTLKENSRKVPAIIRAKAKNIRPNPFEPDFIPEIAKQIMDETLFEVFSASVASYNSYQDLGINGEDIVKMFQYISEKQADKINRCFGITPVKK